ncbi:MAG: hypothetical protein ABIN35_00070 [candidate division WOR-3 bacterium]
MSKQEFYQHLYALLSVQINHGFKICVSMIGIPYISITSRLGILSESIYRTLFWQPSLLNVLNYNNICQTQDPIEIGHIFGVFLIYMIKKEPQMCQYQIRRNIVHNLSLLNLQYTNEKRIREIFCLRRCCIVLMTKEELHDLLFDGKVVP